MNWNLLKQYAFVLLLLGGWTLPVAAQAPTTTAAAGEKPKTDHSYKPLTLKLDEKGDKYLRLITWHQFWITYTQNNPGTTDANGVPQEAAFDIALRRSRFLTYAQVSPRFLILTHWGINNQSFSTGGSAVGGNQAAQANNAGKKPQLFIHDAWTEFEVAKDKLYLGTGIHYWNGISRLSSQSTLNFMTIDAPIFNWPLIETNDQFARQFGIYAKGQLGKLDYRLSINKPFLNGIVANRVSFVNALKAGTASSNVATHAFTENVAYAGYINYMFKDKESNKLPFFVGSHLGSKTVFNLGAGFYIHPEATASIETSTPDTAFTTHNINLFGIDAFYDRPLNKEKGTCLSIYGVLYLYNFGPNYLRNIGILNLHSNASGETATFARGGNAQPTLGTGTIGYLQVGYGLPKLANGTQFMPYATLTYKDFERLNQSSLQYDLGLNYLINGHNAKVSLQYSNRPLYNGAFNRIGSKGELILQTHIFL
ncbi:MAG: porin [Saprospiraceae bacterium]